jgi:hypothetical protein
MSETTPFLLLAFYLNNADLEAIRPHLEPHDPSLPDLHEVGRYYGVPVFASDSSEATTYPPQGLYREVGFRYIPVADVLMG